MLFWKRTERGLTDVCVLPERVAGVLPFEQAVPFEQTPAFERLSFQQLDSAEMTGVLNLALWLATRIRRRHCLLLLLTIQLWLL